MNSEILNKDVKNNEKIFPYWIRVNRIFQAGREYLQLKPKMVTEAYFLLPNGKFQHGIQVSDWDVIVPEALWIGTFEQCNAVVLELKKATPIDCSILPIPSCFLEEKSGILRMNYSYKGNFMKKLVELNMEPVPVTEQDYETDLLNKFKSSENQENSKNQNSKNQKDFENQNNLSENKEKNKEKQELTIGNFLLNLEFMQKVLKKTNLKATYISIYYKRDANDPPLMDNVLDYQACFVRFNPPLPKGWRFMCKLETYAEAFRQRCKNICENAWNIPWSENKINMFLEDSYLLYQITVEIVSNIIFEAELYGNDLEIINGLST